ncbi:hypothetical protein GBAR_LOCUS6972 [Geodia barretti]|nr:hypothetical protein GBAR_LOCUS6972 [Geodia barretti]
MPFKLPPMRDAIRDHGARHSPASRLPLPSEHSLPSSHDSGLEHAGFPRLPSPAHQEHGPAHTGPSSNPPHAISKLAKAKPLPVLPTKQRAAIPIPEQVEDVEPNSPRIKKVLTPPQRKRPSYEHREPFPLPKFPEPKQKAPTSPQKRKIIPSLPVTHQPLDQRPRLATPPEESQPFTLGQREREPTPPKAPTPPQNRKILPVPPAIQQQTTGPSDEHDHTKQAVHPERKRNVPTLPHKRKVALALPVVQTPPEQKKRLPLPPERGLSKSKAMAMRPDPAQRAPEPPGSDEDEYDDAITFQSRPVTQTQQQVTNGAQHTSATNVSKPIPYLIPEKQSENSVGQHFKPQHHHHLPVSPDSDGDEEDYVDATSQQHPITSRGQQHVEKQEPRWQLATKERPRKAPLQPPPPPARASSSHQQTGAPPPAVKPRGSLPRQRHRPPPHSAASSRHVKDPSSTSGDEDSVPSSFADLKRRLEKQLAS